MINVIHFSPAGSTRKVAMTVAEVFNMETSQYDLTMRNMQEIEFSSDDIVVVAVPVYAGRVPLMASKALMKINGGNAKAISVVVYGNRHYNDALIELCDLLGQQGFLVCAGGAFVARHSIIGTIGAERPNDADIEEIKKFAEAAKEKILSSGYGEAIQVPGDRPYRERSANTLPISVSQECISCGLCAEKCPSGAIQASNPNCTDSQMCICCMRCIHICPQQARSLEAPVHERISGYLSQFTEPRENEWYL